eukprot:m.416633 g.416633  ORF g.416633 m.416633 type:complete len:94 (-) comp30048_c0_seq1:263-544(-)
MTKAGTWGVVALVLSVAWGLVLSGQVATNDTVMGIMPFAPFNLLCCFGSYSLFSIGYSLFTFGDADDAADEVKREVIEAKRDLASKGIIVASE